MTLRYCFDDSSGRPWRVIYMCEIVGKGPPRFTSAGGTQKRRAMARDYPEMNLNHRDAGLFFLSRFFFVSGRRR